MNSDIPTTWTIKLLDAGDGTGDAMLCLPDELLESLGWSLGDNLTFSFVENENAVTIVKT
jgi:hypothetical protein